MMATRLVPAALLFDLDGTLADSFEGIQYALNAALREESLPEHELAWVRAHVGRGAAALVQDAVGAQAGEALVRSVTSRYGAIYGATYLERTPAIPNAGEVLAFVSARTGGRVAVVSNKDEALSRGWLRHAGLADHVAVVVGPDTYGVRKPDPGVMLPLLRAFGVPAAEALVIGDMEVDVASAVAAGAPMVGVQPDGGAARNLLAAGAKAVLPSLGALPGWLEDNGRGWRYDAPVNREAER